MSTHIHLTDEEVVAESAKNDTGRYPRESYLELGAMFWYNRETEDGSCTATSGMYIPKLDSVSTSIYRFLIQMERLRLQGAEPDTDAIREIEEAMFVHLQETFGPLPEEFRSRVCAIKVTPPYLDRINNRIFPYRAMLFAKQMRTSC